MALGLPECGPDEMLLPQTVHITPSRVDPWREVRDPESRYTQMQLRELKARGDDPAKVEDVLVRQAASIREMWWPSSRPAPVFVMPCPVVAGRVKDGEQQFKVIAPNGALKWVWVEPCTGPGPLSATITRKTKGKRTWRKT